MKAFVGHSFDKNDSEIVSKIIKYLESLGVSCQSGEMAQNKSVADKVKEKILCNDIFAGIFTCDREIASKKNLFKKKEKYFTTSNWVIQESGFAIGNKKELIFLIETGIYKFPELQGDMEVIFFNRESFEETYVRLAQMIEHIRRGRKPILLSEKLDKAEDIEKEEADIRKEKAIDELKDKKQDATEKLYKSLFVEKDYIKAQQIYEKEVQKILKPEENRIWKAILLRYSHKLGDVKALEKLENYADENKDIPEIINELAFRYKEMGEYQRAKEKFLLVKDLYDMDKEKKKIIDCYEQIGLCLAYDNKYEEAYTLLSQLLHDAKLKEYKAKLLAILARIAKKEKDLEKLFIYAESCLEINPSDTDLRFDLAYNHSKKGNNKLSCLHYKKLINTTKSPVGLNNLGVEYETLNLPAKSIKSYFNAANYNETLAMANIAQSYLTGGFIDDANREIKRANDLSKEGIEIHGNIGLAKNRLSAILEQENKQENEILDEAEKERKFRVYYSEAFYSNNKVKKEELEGIWQTPWGDLQLRFDEGKGIFNVDEELTLKLEGMEGWVKQKTEPPEEQFKKRIVKIEGKIINLSARYDIDVRDIIEYKYIPPDRKNVYEAKGYLVLDVSNNTISVMEKDKEKKLKMDSWKRK